MREQRLFKSWEEAGIYFPATSREKFDMVCPECSDDRKKQNDKCLNINQGNMTFRCNHCNDFFGRIADEVDQLERSKDYHKKVYELPKRPENIRLLPESIEWLESRFISEATANHFQLYSKWMKNKKGELIAWVGMPFIRNGNWVNIKTRTPERQEFDEVKNEMVTKKDFQLEPGCETIFFNLDAIRGQREVIICEGEMGAMSWHEAGFPNVISVPNGVPLSKEEKKYYEDHNEFPPNTILPLPYVDTAWDELSQVETFYIAVDDDIAGRKLRQELVRRLGAERCKIVTFTEPDGTWHKDEGDLVKATGNRFVLAKYLKAAAEVPIEGVLDLESQWQKMLDLYDHGMPYGHPTGIQEFDGYYSFMLRELDIVTGYPGQGKTTFMVFYMAWTAVVMGWKWAILCPESLEPHELFHMLNQAILGFTADKKVHTRMSRNVYVTGKHFLQEHFLILDINRIDSMDDAVARFDHLVRRKGINACLIDPWNDVPVKLKPGEDMHQYNQRQLTNVRRLKDRGSLKFVIGVHPRTPRERDENGQLPVPGANGIDGGNMWWNKADNMWVLQRHYIPENPDCTLSEIHILKIKKHGYVGKPTPKDNPIMLDFDWQTRRYYGWKSRQTIPPLTPEQLGIEYQEPGVVQQIQLELSQVPVKPAYEITNPGGFKSFEEADVKGLYSKPKEIAFPDAYDEEPPF